MSQVGNTILASEYNAIQTKIARVLGTGDGNFGYGQPLTSSQVSTVNITEVQWDNLRTDLLKARQHQTGVNESANLTDIAVGNTVLASHYTQYNNFSDTVTNNRFNIAVNQQEQTATVTGTTGVWNGTKVATVTFSFPNANAARFFFNSGGVVSVNGTAGVFGGAPKDQSWWDMTNNVFVTVAGPSFYNLSDQFVRVVNRGAAAGVYVENRYYIDVRCNAANNSIGGATQVIFRFIFEDNDIGDQTGTGPAVDEDVNGASVSGRAIRSIGNVVVAAPSISAPNF
jgi:hypothetical protein